MSKVRELRDAGYLYDGTADEPELAAERTISHRRVSA